MTIVFFPELFSPFGGPWWYYFFCGGGAGCKRRFVFDRSRSIVFCRYPSKRWITRTTASDRTGLATCVNNSNSGGSMHSRMDPREPREARAGGERALRQYSTRTFFPVNYDNPLLTIRLRRLWRVRNNTIRGGGIGGVAGRGRI